MSKTIWYIIGAIIIIGGIVWYATSASNRATTTSENATTTAVMAANTTAVTAPSTVSALLSLSVPQTCTFDNNVNGSSVTGTIYVANGQLRADLTNNINSVITYIHTILSATTVYTWEDGQTVGVKTSRTSADNTIASNVDLSMLQNFACTTNTSVKPDFTKFNLPTGVSFKTPAAVAQ